MRRVSSAPVGGAQRRAVVAVQKRSVLCVVGLGARRSISNSKYILFKKNNIMSILLVLECCQSGICCFAS